jgi:hypothetical protein
VQTNRQFAHDRRRAANLQIRDEQKNSPLHERIKPRRDEETKRRRDEVGDDRLTSSLRLCVSSSLFLLFQSAF